MAQIFWEQIRNALPAIGEYLTGSLTVSGSLGVTGSIFYNGQLLEDFVDERALSATTDFSQITNKPADLFSGSFIAGPNITINQIGQRVEISSSAATSYNNLTDIPVGIVSSSNQVNFFDLNNLPSGLVSSSNQITLTTSSITDFNEGVISASGQAYIDSSIQGNLLSFTRLNGGSDAVDLGDVVPSTPTGSLVYSGSYDEDNGLFTLYRNDGNIDVDLSSLGGGGGGGTVSAGSGIDVDYNVGTNTYTVSADVSPIFGTEIKGEYIAIATGSNYFIEAVLKSGLFRQTGSYWATSNDLQITGSLSVDVTGSGEEFTLLKDGEEKFKLNQDGVVLFVSQSSTPSAVAGGMYYDQADIFYLGFQN
tara:strand:+ start:337 stop:1428 length:1092 start_codon:yes stop_codon:yes gene_type:complete